MGWRGFLDIFGEQSLGKTFGAESSFKENLKVLGFAYFVPLMSVSPAYGSVLRGEGMISRSRCRTAVLSKYDKFLELLQISSRLLAFDF